MSHRATVIGIGNADRGDDAVGLHVARRVADADPGLRVVELADPSQALDVWEREDVVVVTDAVTSGGTPGAIQVVDAVAQPLPTGSWASGGTHAFGIAAVVELGRALGRLPGRLLVVGVEASRFDRGAPMSEPVASAVPEAARAVLSALDGGGGQP